jgi:hypothetical protein
LFFKNIFVPIFKPYIFLYRKACVTHRNEKREARCRKFNLDLPPTLKIGT